MNIILSRPQTEQTAGLYTQCIYNLHLESVDYIYTASVNFDFVNTGNFAVQLAL